jgi:protein-S-isoprenylcysteine O-methyltransferase Ste14
MTKWGIGIKLAALTLVFTAALAAADRFLLPHWRLSFIGRGTAFIIGGVLIACGAGVLVIATRAVYPAFRQGRLVTTGIFGIVRNPIYAAWTFLIVPGILLITRCAIMWLVPVFMYASFKVLIRTEDEYLERKFGAEYRAYRAKTGELFPRLW